MIFKINFGYESSEQDSFIIEAETMEEIRLLAAKGIKKRGGLYAWSEALESIRK